MLAVRVSPVDNLLSRKSHRQILGYVYVACVCVCIFIQIWFELVTNQRERKGDWGSAGNPAHWIGWGIGLPRTMCKKIRKYCCLNCLSNCLILCYHLTDWIGFEVSYKPHTYSLVQLMDYRTEYFHTSIFIYYFNIIFYFILLIYIYLFSNCEPYLNGNVTIIQTRSGSALALESHFKERQHNHVILCSNLGFNLANFIVLSWF